MKSNKERARYILETSEKRLKQKRVKRKKTEKCLAGVFSICAVLAVSVTILNTDLMETVPAIPEQKTDNTFSTETKNTEATITHLNEISSIETQINTTQTEPEKFTEPAVQTDIFSTGTEGSMQPEIAPEVTAAPTSEPDEYTELPPAEPPLRWEDMPINRQYFMCEYNENEYQTEELEISSEYVGDKLGTGWMSGWDNYTDTYYHCDAEVFSLIEKTTDNFIAVRFVGDDNFYIYKNCTLFTDDSMLDMTG